MAALDTDGHAIARRKAIKIAAACLLTEVGFGSCEESAMETIVEAMQAYIFEIGRSSKAYAELAGRTEPMVTDVVIALIEMGLDISGIPAHARRLNAMTFQLPGVCSQTPTPRTLQVGERKPHPPHIPDHLPPFPDPHTYIKTDALRQPFNDYQVIRERSATQKMEVDKALTRFMANTGETQSLFKDDSSAAYKLIAVKPVPLPYLAALLSKDQDLEEESGKGQREDSSQADIDNPYLRPPRIVGRKRASCPVKDPLEIDSERPS